MGEVKNRRYRSVSIPTDLADEIENIVEDFKGLGFTSVADFVKTACREKIERIKMRRVANEV